MKLLATSLFFWAFGLATSYALSPISGCVRDSAQNPVPDASVMFYQSDSLTAGLTTDHKGCFVLRLDTGQYVLRINKLGYKEHETSIILTTSGKNLQTITLGKTVFELGEVTVTANSFEAELNKSSFRISSQVKKVAVDVYQVLSSVPMIMTDPVLKSIKVSGAENMIVMVNNIRRGVDYLSVLDKENIDKVEIIRSPGARYKDVDAILNIVTKNPVIGQSANLNGQLDPLLRYGQIGGSYTYVADKLTASVNAQGFFMDEGKEKTSVDRVLEEDDKTTRTEKNSDDGTLAMNSLFLGATVDYNVSPNTFLSVNGRYINSPQKTKHPYHGTVFSNDQKDYDYDALDESESSYENYQLGSYFQTKWKGNKSMNIDLNYSATSTQSDNLYREWNNSGYAYQNNQENNNQSKNLNGQVNFGQQLQKVKLEEGYRLYWQGNDYHNTANGIANEAQHDEWRNYFYVNALGKFNEKWAYQLSGGMDLVKTTLNGVSSTNSEVLPEAMLRYFVSGKQNFTLSYALSRRSPSSSMLNPIAQYIDSSRVVFGNPQLSPTYLNRVGLSYEYSGGKFYMRTSVQYRFANSYLTTKEYLENGIYYVTYTDAARYSSKGFSLYLSWNVLPGWKIMADAFIAHLVYQSDQLAQLNKKYWSPDIDFQSSFYYKNWSAYLFYPLNIRTSTLTGYQTSTKESWINAAYRINKAWSITVDIRYLNPLKYKRETYMDHLSEVYYSHREQRFLRFMIGFRYYFQKGKQQNSKWKETKGYNDEMNIDTKVY